MNLHDRDNFLRGKKEGITQGAEQTKIQTAKNLILDKIPLEQIVKWTNLSLEKVQELADSSKE